MVTLRITPKAADHLVRVRAERGFDASHGARFVRGSNGVGLTFVRRPHAEDDIMGSPGLPIYVAKDVTPALSRAIIDQAVDDHEEKLVVRLQEAASEDPDDAGGSSLPGTSG